MVPLSSRNALVILSSFSLPFPFHTLQSEKGVTWLAWIPFILPKWHIGPYYLSSTYVFHDRHVVDNSHGTLWSSMVSCFHLPSWLWMVIRNIRTLGPREELGLFTLKTLRIYWSIKRSPLAAGDDYSPKCLIFIPYFPAGAEILPLAIINYILIWTPCVCGCVIYIFDKPIDHRK